MSKRKREPKRRHQGESGSALPTERADKLAKRQGESGIADADLLPPRNTTADKPLSLSLADLASDATVNRCLAAPMPEDDAPIEQVLSTLKDWHQAFELSARKTAMLAWRIGRLLYSVRERTKHGEWEQWVQDNLAGIGISLSTAKRYIRLAKYFTEPEQLEKRNILAAYQDAGVVTDARTNVDDLVIAYMQLRDDIKRIIHRLIHLAGQREYLPDKLMSDDYGDRADMLRVFRAELDANTELLVLRNTLGTAALPIAPRTSFHEKCKRLAEWIDAERMSWMKYDSEVFPEKTVSNPNFPDDTCGGVY